MIVIRMTDARSGYGLWFAGSSDAPFHQLRSGFGHYRNNNVARVLNQFILSGGNHERVIQQ